MNHIYEAETTHDHQQDYRYPSDQRPPSTHPGNDQHSYSPSSHSGNDQPNSANYVHQQAHHATAPPSTHSANHIDYPAQGNGNMGPPMGQYSSEGSFGVRNRLIHPMSRSTPPPQWHTPSDQHQPIRPPPAVPLPVSLSQSSSAGVKRKAPSRSKSNPTSNELEPEAAGRKANFTPDEDLQLCHSWLNISQDPIIGNGQTSTSMWLRIAADFEKHMRLRTDPADYIERTEDSLQCRWRPMNRMINKYVGYLSKVKNFHGSGKSAHDITADAHEMYLQREKHVFKHVRCHALLSTAPKWADYNIDLARRANPNPPIPSPSVISIRSSIAALTDVEDSDIEVISSDGHDRPMGNKFAKRTKHVDAILSDLSNSAKALAANSGSIALDSRTQAAAFDFLTDDLILKTDLNSLQGDIRLFYQLRQAEIIKKRMAMLNPQ